MKRVSQIPIRRYVIPQSKPRCVGCGKDVNPGLCYTGSIAVGVSFGTKTTVELVKVNPVQYQEFTRRIPIVERKKGLICTGCASNYHTFVDAMGVSHPIVVTDARPGYNETIAGHGLRADAAMVDKGKREFGKL